MDTNINEEVNKENSFVNEFNADNDTFEFGESIKDENIIDDYDNNILNEDNESFPFGGNIFDDKKDTIELGD